MSEISSDPVAGQSERAAISAPAVGGGGDPRVSRLRQRLRVAHEASRRPSPQAAHKLARQAKLPVRDRITLLLDPDSFVEDGRYANALAPGFPPMVW